MAISNEINLILYNHKSKLGIEDFVKIYMEIFTNHGFNVTHSSKLEKNAINIIIEEFTCPYFQKEIKDFKKEKKGFVYVIPTEFITKLPFGLKTFNFFNKSLFEAMFFNIIFIFIKIFYYIFNRCFVVYFYRISKSFLIDLFKKTKFKIINLIKLSPEEIKNLIKLFLKAYKNLNKLFLKAYKNLNKLFTKSQTTKTSYKYQAFRRLVYNLKRYDSFNKSSKYIDGYIHIHKVIKGSYESEYPNINSFITNPIININKFKKKFAKNKYGFYMTGTITKYRDERFNLLEMKILRNNKRNPYFRISSFKVDSKLTNEFYNFSFNPGQSKDWIYSSPTRLYRSINENGSIPIIDLRNYDSDIERLAILFNSNIQHSTNEYNSASIKFKNFLLELTKYNNVSFKINSVLCKHLQSVLVNT